MTADPKEVREIYERYGHLVRARCFAILGTQTDADDVFHEVFVRLQRFGLPRNEAVTLHWLYRIAAHCCYDFLAKLKREGPHSPEAIEERASAPDTAASPAVSLALRKVLLKVDAKAREIGLLHHLSGYTQEEIADLVGYSRRTVGKKLKLFEDEFRRFSAGTELER